MLDSIDLLAITQEAKICFLQEDVPEYLTTLKEGILQLKNNQLSSEEKALLYKELRRAAHSIKGGAGMGEMTVISNLAHKVEDIFEALQDDRIVDLDTSFQLLNIAIDELDNLINLEINGTLTQDYNVEIIAILNEFLKGLNPPSELTEIGFADDDFIKTALKEDLSACLERVREILDNPDTATEKNITNSLNILIQECQLLGQALNCYWLVNLSDTIKNLWAKNTFSLHQFTRMTIEEIAYHQQQYLEGDNQTPPTFSETFKQLLTEDKNKPTVTKNKGINDVLINKNLKIPVTKINIIGEVVSQLLIIYERLSLYENQIKQASGNLKQKTKLLTPLKEQIEFIYDKLTINQSQELLLSKNNDKSEFDSLEFDQYNQVHTALQSLTELITQIQEVREDFDLINRDFQETLIEMRNSLDIIDRELRQVRLVPFITLAGSFIKPLEKLNKSYNKSVELVIEGQQVLIDQNILENLRTPFNHLIRNAFDHGIETEEERQKKGKSLPAKINLKAKIQGNNIILTIADDGKGIDLKKIYQKALDLKLFSHNKDFSQLSQQEILETIFSPGFSTASQVSELSGRGMGMDIVKAEIEKLKGTIQVNTNINKGTEFTLKIPMPLNIISLLLVKTAHQLLAIPSENILRIIRLSDYQINDRQLTWEEEKIAVYNLYEILPYPSFTIQENSHPYIGLLLKIGTEKVILTVDAIIDEKPLITKNFDDIVTTPPYLGGCTILGNGTLVPILVPDYLKPLLKNETTEGETPEKKEAILRREKKPSIMIIDDSVTVRRSLNRVLNQGGYKVIQCGDGKEAWNLLQNPNLQCDLAICDLEMPGIDGYKVLQLIRQSEKWHHLPVIILTSRNNDLHREKALNLGANMYLTKPFNPLNFLQTVETIFSYSRDS